MFKKALQVVTTFGVLLVGYAAYTRAFALLVSQLVPVTRSTRSGGPIESRTKRGAINLACKAFGRGHWTNDEDLQIRYYNREHGYWMYAKEYDRLNDGKRLVLTPVAVILQNRNSQALKTITGDSATVDFDKPFGLQAKPGEEPAHVVHARIEGHVVLRDDKGTADPADDLRVTGLNYVDYEESTLKITGDDNDTVDIVDRDMRITGKGVVIKLRPKDPATLPPGAHAAAAGFEGAQTAILKKDVHFVINDVGSQGILTGSSQPQQRQGDKTPLDLRSDGDGTENRPAMRIDLPKPRMPVKVGPPAPSDPTFARFLRNVEVLRGKAGITPDKLNCDDFYLTLVPADKPPAAAKPEIDKATGQPQGQDPVEARAQAQLASVQLPPADGQAQSQTPAEGSGPLTDLTLRRAEATGHNVRLASAAQGLKVRCNELIQKKQLPDAPDVTYLRGDATTLLIVEKTDTVPDGPDKGKVSSFTTIRAIDATIFDPGPSKGPNQSTIEARGPGELETRPGLDKPVERTAKWADELIFQPEPILAAKPGEPAPSLEPRKRLTLTGHPSFADIASQTKLTAEQKLVVWLRPKGEVAAATVVPATATAPAPTLAKAGEKAPAKAGDKAEAKPDPGPSFEIERLTAQRDVHLTAPGKTLVARDWLDADFVPPPLPAKAPAAAATPAPGTPAAAAPAIAATTPEKPAEPAKPAEPEAKATANRVWARIRLLPEEPGKPHATTTAARTGSSSSLTSTGDRRAEVDKVYLRGAVTVHQDPAPGKGKGTHVTGEAVDVLNQGGGSNMFVIYHREPPVTAAKPATSVSPTGSDPARFAPLAKVDTDEMTITGEIIRLDQSTDYAWVEGPGSLTQMTTRGLLSDKGLTNPPKPAAAPAPASRTPVRPASYVVAADDATPRNAKEKEPELARANPKAKAKAKTPADGPVQKVPLTVTWATGMKFWGQSTNKQGQPAGKAEFYDDVRADMEDSSMACDNVMRVFLDRTVKLNRPAEPKPAAADVDPDEDQPAEPQADIAVIELVENVVVINVKRDPLDPRTIAQKQQIQGNYLIYDKATGRFRVPGAGTTFLWDRGGDSSLAPQLGLPGGNAGTKPKPGGNSAPGTRPNPPAPLPNPDPGSTRVIRPTAGPPTRSRQGQPPVVGRNDTARRTDGLVDAKRTNPPKPEKLPYTITQVKFSRDMIGRFGSGKETDKLETRWADFFTDVEAVHGPVANTDSVLDPDRLGPDASFLASQVLRVISEPDRANPDGPARTWLKAWENATATTEDKTIQADTITYDSEKSLFYAYGEEGRDVVIAQQSGIGQGASNMQGRAARYNSKTGEAQVVEPGSIAMFDQKTGKRPQVMPPTSPDGALLRPKRQPMRNPRVNIERKDFTGR